MIYLVALSAKNVMIANAACFKCRSALLAPLSMKKVFESTEAVFSCPSCVPPKEAKNALLTLSIADEAIQRGLDLTQFVQLARKN